MERLFEEDWAEDRRNTACSLNFAIDIILYSSGLARENYSEMDEEDRKFVREVHGHLKKCILCREGYSYAKEVYSCNNNFKNLFNEEHFRMIKKNESHLDSLYKGN